MIPQTGTGLTVASVNCWLLLSPSSEVRELNHSLAWPEKVIDMQVGSQASQASLSTGREGVGFYNWIEMMSSAQSRSFSQAVPLQPTADFHLNIN